MTILMIRLLIPNFYILIYCLLFKTSSFFLPLRRWLVIYNIASQNYNITQYNIILFHEVKQKLVLELPYAGSLSVISGIVSVFFFCSLLANLLLKNKTYKFFACHVILSGRTIFNILWNVWGLCGTHFGNHWLRNKQKTDITFENI